MLPLTCEAGMTDSGSFLTAETRKAGESGLFPDVLFARRVAGALRETEAPACGCRDGCFCYAERTRHPAPHAGASLFRANPPSCRLRSFIPIPGIPILITMPDSHSSDLGKVRCSLRGRVVAGSWRTCVVTYTAGFAGVDDTGSLKIVMRYATDVGRTRRP